MDKNRLADFIHSDDRWSERSLGAITRRFAVSEAEVLAAIAGDPAFTLRNGLKAIYVGHEGCRQ